MFPDAQEQAATGVMSMIGRGLSRFWRFIVVLGFFSIGLVIAMVGLQSPIVTLVLAVFLIIGGVARQTDRSNGWPVAPCALVLVALFLALAAASLAWTPDRHEAQKQLIQFSYTLIPIACAIGVIIKLPNYLLVRMQWALIIGVLIGLTILVFEVRDGQVLHHWIQGLKPGELSINTFNRALVGMAMLIFPVVGAVLARGQNNLAIVIPVAYGALLTLSESQTALLGIIAGSVVYVLAVRAPKLMLGFVGGLFIALSIGAIPLAFGLDATGLASADWLMLSARHRIEVWYFAAQQILESPWIGYGLESAQKNFPRAGEISSFLPVDINMVHRHPHNLFLQIWYEFGLLGAVIIMLTGIVMLWRLSKFNAPTQHAGIATFAACLAMVSVTSFSIWHTWFMCTLALALFAVLLLASDPVEKPKNEAQGIDNKSQSEEVVV